MVGYIVLRGAAGSLFLEPTTTVVTVLQMAEVTGLHVVDLSLEWEPHLVRGDA